MSAWPSHTLGSTNTSAAASSAGTSPRWPANRTVEPERRRPGLELGRERSLAGDDEQRLGLDVAPAGGGVEQQAEPLLRGQPAGGEHDGLARVRPEFGAERRPRVSAETSRGGNETGAAGTTAWPTRRAPAARIRSSRSADTHSTESALRATISSSTR